MYIRIAQHLGDFPLGSGEYPGIRDREKRTVRFPQLPSPSPYVYVSTMYKTTCPVQSTSSRTVDKPERQGLEEVPTPYLSAYVLSPNLLGNGDNDLLGWRQEPKTQLETQSLIHNRNVNKKVLPNVT